MAKRWTAAKKKRFLAKIEESPNVTAACKHVGMGRASFYVLLKNDKQFKADYEAAEETGGEALAEVVEDRALNGHTETTEWYDKDGNLKGKKVVHKFDARREIAALMAHNRKYRKKLDVEGGLNLRPSLVEVFAELNRAQ